jgi:hypothetical protein
MMYTSTLNLEAALDNTQDLLPELIHDSIYSLGATPEKEPLWLVDFMGKYGECLVVEVIIRDGGIVLSVLNTIGYTPREVVDIMNTFTEALQIIDD